MVQTVAGMKPTLLALALVALGCSAQRPQIATMPPDIRAGWDRCETAVTAWCGDHSHHQPTEERNCVEDASRQYAALTEAAARANFLQSHGCAP